MPYLEPVHPGQILRHEVFSSQYVSVSKAAKAMKVSRQALYNIMKEDAPTRVTVAMALRLGKYFGTTPHLWTNLQMAYDLWHAEEKLATA